MVSWAPGGLGDDTVEPQCHQIQFVSLAPARPGGCGPRCNERSRFTWAVRLPVAPLRPTNRETVEPRAFARPQLLRPHNTRIAEASSPSAPLPNAVIEDRHRHKYPGRAPVLVPRRPLGSARIMFFRCYAICPEMAPNGLRMMSGPRLLLQ